MSGTDTIRIDVKKSVIAEIIMERLEGMGITPPGVISADVLPRIGEPWQGGIYAGLTIHDNAPHVLVLLPEEAENVNWKDALTWAEQQGGLLPSRFDALVLFENLKGKFQPEWYWTGAQHASYESCAWLQSFHSGYQTYDHKDSNSRARAVRRSTI